MSSLEDDFERVRRERDPVRQGRLATELLGIYQARTTELARLRKAALKALQDEGLSYAEIAAAFGLSKARVGQIRHGGPPVERAFFGMGPVTVAFPQRHLSDRALPVIASEDALAVDRLDALLTDLALEVVRFPIPPDGEWQPTGDTVAICGPKNSHVTADALQSDPVLAFEPDDAGRWHLADRVTGETYYTPSDVGGPADAPEIAYVGRVRVGEGTMLVIAGVHAPGSVAAVDYLTRNLADLYAVVGDERFSMITSGTFDGDTLASTEVLCEPRLHREYES